MFQKKCPVCTKVKGKRGCLLNANKLICSQCCAQIRNSQCEGCGYYQESQQFSAEKAKKAPQKIKLIINEAVDKKIDAALSLVESGKIAEAEKRLTTLAKENADLHSVHYALGTLYAVKGDYDAAIHNFDKSIAIFPYYTDCWFNRGIAAKNKLDIAEMVFSLQKVIEYGNSAEDVVQTSQELLTTITEGICAEFGLSLEDYVKALKLFDSAFDLMQSKKWHEAIEVFNQSLAINPISAPAFGNLALCYMNLTENELSMQMFDKALEIDPLYEPALLNRELLKKGIKQNISLSDLPTKTIQYAADYSLNDNKSLIDDYAKDKL